VGKTRLTETALDLARQSGFVPLTGQTVEGASLPYSTLISALRRHLRVQTEADIADLFRGMARSAAALLPEVADLVGLGSSQMAAEHLDAAVVSLFATMATRQPVLLLLEDLHWAGPDMVRVLGTLVRDLRDHPVWIVGTLRSDEVDANTPLRELLDELRRDRHTDILVLGDLDAAGVHEMVGAIFPGAVLDPALVERIAAHSAGRPLVVEELCRSLIDQGAVDLDHGSWQANAGVDWTIPPTVRDILLRAFHRLDASARAVLEAAALCEEPFAVDLLVAASAADPADVDRAVAAGLRAGVLRRQGDAAEPRLSFGHALTREAVSAELGIAQSRAVHSRLGEALRAAAEDRQAPVAARAAYHLAEAERIEESVAMSLLAARYATSMAAVGDAVEHFEHARTRSAPDSAMRLRVIVDELEYLETLNRTVAPVRGLSALADDRIAEAKALATGQADDVARFRVARVATVIARDTSWTAALEEAAQWVEAAAGLGDRWELLSLVNWLNIAELQDAAYADRHRRLRSLVDTVDDDPVAVNSGYRVLMALCCDADEMQDLFRGALDAARQIGDGFEYFVTHASYACTRRELGLIADAAAAADTALELSERAAPLHRPGVQYEMYHCAVLSGDRGRAATLHDALRASGQLDADQLEVDSFEERLRFGTREQAVAAARRAEAMAESSLPPYVRGPVLSTAARGRLLADPAGAGDAAWAALEACGRNTVDHHWLLSPDVARALLRLGRIDELDRWREALARFGGYIGNAAALAFVDGCAALGHDAPAVAATHLQNAIDLLHRMPYPARECEAWLMLSEARQRLGIAEDAVEAAAAAFDIARRIDSPALIDESGAALRRLGDRTLSRRISRPRLADSVLTRREQEIVTLVHRGLTNQQIADTLYISQTTAAKHVSNILGKLDLENRIALARWADQPEAPV